MAATIATSGAALAQELPNVRVIQPRQLQAPTISRKLLVVAQNAAFVAPPIKPDTSDWYLQGKQLGWPSTVALGADRQGIGLFARSTAGYLVWRRTGDIGADWTNTGVKLEASPACVSSWDNGDTVDCFWTTNQGTLRTVTLNKGKASQIDDLGGQLAGTPAPVRIGQGIAVVVKGANGKLLAIRGNPRTVVGASYPWAAWEELGVKSYAVMNNPTCSLTITSSSAAKNYSDPYDVRCYVPMTGGLGLVYPYANVGSAGNNLMEVTPYDSFTSPSFVATGPFPNGYSTAILAYIAKSGGLMLTTSLGIGEKNQTWTDLHGKASSQPSCALIGPAIPGAKFACAVQRADGSVWVREFNLTS